MQGLLNANIMLIFEKTIEMDGFFTKTGKKLSFARMAWKFSDVLPKIPRTVGGLAVTFFKESWRRQGWLDKSLQKWLPRRHPSPSDAGKAILVQRGHLRNSIRILSSDSQSVVVGSTLPYAEPHNDGGRGSVTVRQHTRRTPRGGLSTVRQHTRAMNVPQRRFIGDSSEVNKLVDKKIEAMIDSVFKTD